MGLSERQQAAIQQAHAGQMRELQHTVAMMTQDELQALTRTVTDLHDAIVWEQQRRARADPGTTAPGTPGAVMNTRMHAGRGRPKLRDDQVRAIRHAYDTAPTKRGVMKRLAAQYGVYATTIAAIVKRKTRLDVD